MWLELPNSDIIDAGMLFTLNVSCLTLPISVDR